MNIKKTLNKISFYSGNSLVYLGLLAGFGQFIVWFFACTSLLTLTGSIKIAFLSFISYIITFIAGQDSLGKIKNFNIPFYIGSAISILTSITILVLR